MSGPFHDVSSFGDEFAEFHPMEQAQNSEEAGQEAPPPQEGQLQPPQFQQQQAADMLHLQPEPQQPVIISFTQPQFQQTPSEQPPVTLASMQPTLAPPQDFILPQEEPQLPQEAMDMLSQQVPDLAAVVSQAAADTAAPSYQPVQTQHVLQEPLQQLQIQQQQQLEQPVVPVEQPTPVVVQQPVLASPPQAAPAPAPAPAPRAAPAAKAPTRNAGGRKKKDPNAPASVSSAYAYFFKETQAGVKEHNPNAQFGEVSKLVASMWQAMADEDKTSYKKKNEEDKVRFEREMGEYKARQEAVGAVAAEAQQPVVKKVVRRRGAAAAAVATASAASANGGGGVVLVTGAHGKVSAAKAATSAISPAEVPSSASEDEEEASEGEKKSLCIRDGCTKKSVKNVEWEDEYCSNSCVVEHCKNVFRRWTMEQA